LQQKGLQVSPKITATRTQNMVPTPAEPPAFNKEIMYDERQNGIKMPLLNEKGDVIRRKRYGEKRATIEANLAALRRGDYTVT